MAVLARQTDALSLGSHTLIGRGASCHLRLERRAVSADHAILTHVRGRWFVRDIGSRNGTWLDGSRLGVGEPIALLRGARLEFGGPGEPWELVDDGPPGPAAVRWKTQDRGAPSMDVQCGEHGLLALPDAQEPVALVYADDAGGWLIERGEVAEPLGTSEVVAGWRVLAPRTRIYGDSPSTWDLADAPRVERIGLRLAPSRDGEHVDVVVMVAGRTLALPPRAHHFLTLALARARLDDAATGAPPEEQGWIYADELARMLRLDATQLNLQLFRARQQLAEAGVADAGRLFERRRLSRQLRLAVAELSVG